MGHSLTRSPAGLQVWCFGNLLGGPFIEFSAYRDFIRQQGLWDPAKKPPKLPAFLQVCFHFKACKGRGIVMRRWEGRRAFCVYPPPPCFRPCLHCMG